MLLFTGTGNDGVQDACQGLADLLIGEQHRVHVEHYECPQRVTFLLQPSERAKHAEDRFVISAEGVHAGFGIDPRQLAEKS